MKRKIGRNEPCPCGSGRKFKLCCSLAHSAQHVDASGLSGLDGDPSALRTSGRFRFEAGSYGGPGGYLPSIACLKREEQGGWAYHFVLVIPDELREEEETASLESGEHLFKAFRGGPSPDAMARRLKKLGYVSVSDFHVVTEGSRVDEGFAPGFDEHD